MANGPGERAAVDIRRARAVEMRVKGATWQQIADALGYADRGAACGDIRRFREQTRAEAEERLDELRELEVDRLDMLIRAATTVLEAHHIVIQGGKAVMVGPEGAEQEVIDHGPVLQAVAAIAKLSESRRKLLGVDAPVKLDAQFEVKYTVNGVTSDDLT